MSDARPLAEAIASGWLPPRDQTDDALATLARALIQQIDNPTMPPMSINLTRRWAFHHSLTLGDLRAIVAEAEHRRLPDDAHVTVNAHDAFIADVNPDGNPDKPYPDGNGGHYVTSVVIRGNLT